MYQGQGQGAACVRACDGGGGQNAKCEGGNGALCESRLLSRSLCSRILVCPSALPRPTPLRRGPLGLPLASHCYAGGRDAAIMAAAGGEFPEASRAFTLLAAESAADTSVSPPETLLDSEGRKSFSFLVSLRFDVSSEDPRVRKGDGRTTSPGAQNTGVQPAYPDPRPFPRRSPQEASLAADLEAWASRWDVEPACEVMFQLSGGFPLSPPEVRLLRPILAVSRKCGAARSRDDDTSASRHAAGREAAPMDAPEA
jgi:hypothetical protein